MKAAFLIIFSFSLVRIQIFAQVTLPIDEKTGKTLYTEVVQVEGVTADELFKRAEKWFNTYFKNPGSVIKEKDAAKGLISGQHGIYVYNEVDGNKNQKGLVKYFIKVFLKEGRYKYEIDDIFLLASPKIYIEQWLDPNAVNKDIQMDYVRQVDTHIKALIEDLKKSMLQPSSNNSQDDW